MKIYTTAASSKIDKYTEFDVGVMIPTPSKVKLEVFKGIDCALDNGAFNAFRRGYPTPVEEFEKQIANCFKSGLSLDFLVAPDIVAGGIRSLDYSVDYVEAQPGGRWALAVQDGMKTTDVIPYLHLFEFIFVGGSVKWKWKTITHWVDLAKRKNMQIHVGQVGLPDRIKYCRELGVDSIDSSSFARNDTWKYTRQSHGNLFDDAGKVGHRRNDR